MNEENENVVIDGDELDNTNNDSTQEEIESETLNDESFEDEESEENPKEDNVESTDKKQPDKATEKKSLSKEERSKFAELRREAEQKEKIEQKAYRKGLVDAVNGINPFTNEEIKTEEDIDELINMREAQKAGYDPVSEYSKFLKFKRQKQNESTANNFDYDSDRKDFEKSYPDIDLESLVADDEFNDFAEGLVGTIPLKAIYGKYQKFQAKLEKQLEQRVLKEMSKGKSSAGSLQNKQERKSKSFSDMSDDEFEKQIELAKSGGLAAN